MTRNAIDESVGVRRHYWPFELGQILTRADVNHATGSNIQGGITPSRSTEQIILYSDREVSASYGYPDGYSSDEQFFLYGGEGVHGNQELVGNNRSVLHSTEKGIAIRLLYRIGTTEGRQQKTYKYLGLFEVDPYRAFKWRWLPDRAGNDRRVVVFQLRPVGDVLLVEPVPELVRQQRGQNRADEGAGRSASARFANEALEAPVDAYLEEVLRWAAAASNTSPRQLAARLMQRFGEQMQ